MSYSHSSVQDAEKCAIYVLANRYKHKNLTQLLLLVQIHCQSSAYRCLGLQQHWIFAHYFLQLLLCSGIRNSLQKEANRLTCSGRCSANYSQVILEVIQTVIVWFLRTFLINIIWCLVSCCDICRLNLYVNHQLIHLSWLWLCIAAPCYVKDCR